MSFTITEIKSDNPINTLLNDKWTSPNRKAYVEVGDDKVCLPSNYKSYATDIANFEVRNDDVFLCGFPKTGTSWSCELIWLLCNNLNYEEAKNNLVTSRFHQLEFISLFDEETVSRFMNTQYKSFNWINDQPSPRFIKTHLHWSLMPEQIKNGSKTPKIIYVTRNPEDTCLSYYHYSKGIEKYCGTREEFCELFLAGKVSFGPYSSQVLGFWKEKHRSNILIVKYEDMKTDLPNVIKKIANFLDKKITEEEITALTIHLSFDKMKDNPSVNYEHIINYAKREGYIDVDMKFMRSGQVGGYKSELSEEMVEKFRKWKMQNLNIQEIIYNC